MNEPCQAAKSVESDAVNLVLSPYIIQQQRKMLANNNLQHNQIDSRRQVFEQCFSLVDL